MSGDIYSHGDLFDLYEFRNNNPMELEERHRQVTNLFEDLRKARLQSFLREVQMECGC
jgi:hypothetical protein